MEEIIKLIQDKTGISEENAKTALNTVANFLKDKLPAPIASQVENVLSGKVDTGLKGISNPF